MTSYLYRKWGTAWNKDELKYFDSAAFRADYTELEMESKAGLFERVVTQDVEDFLENIGKYTNQRYIRVLSLGCGPGSDLLGLLRAIDWVLQSNETIVRMPRRPTISCTGVDAFDWHQCAFHSAVDQMRYNGALGGIHCEFHVQGMDSFVHDSSQDDGLIADRYDFICLSFADAGRNLHLIGTALPRLLTQFGQVLVLDNDLPSVRRLADYGYQVFKPYPKLCYMRTTGQSWQMECAPYRPALHSPVALYSLRKSLDAIQQRLEEVQDSFRTMTLSYY